MSTIQLDLDGRGQPPLRSRRRPALACQECRRRKIKCDRQTPCGPCSRASINSCSYVYDTRGTANTAPFEPQDTRFTVFEQAPQQQQQQSPSPPQEQQQQLQPFSLVSDLNFAPAYPATAPSNPERLSSSDKPSDAPTTGFDPARMPPFPWSPVFQTQPSQAVAQPDSPPRRTIQSVMNSGSRGVFNAGRFNGQSHWLNYAQPCAEVTDVIDSHESDAHIHSVPTIARCEAMVNAINARDLMLARTNDAVLADLIPRRTICDELMQAYMRTSQPMLGLLDVTSFLRAYRGLWSDAVNIGDSFRAMLLLVMVIGSKCVIQEASVNKAMILEWINAVSRWSHHRLFYAGLDLEAIRIQCLYLVACRVHSIRTDHPWAEAKGIVDRAMRLGLHIDPRKQPASNQLSSTQAQSQRKLWAGVLELVLQDCVDAGLPPSITSSDYNCEPPDNIDDVDVDQNSISSDSRYSSQPTDRLTPSSFPILLMQLAPVRLKIAAYVNKIDGDMTYKEALQLQDEFSAILKNCTLKIRRYSTANSFQIKLFDLLVQRFILALHHPFAARADTNPEFYFSRKLCFEASVTLLSPETYSEHDSLHPFRLSGNGFLLDSYTQASLFMCHQLLCDWNSHSEQADATGIRREWNNLVRNEMIKAIDNYVRLLRSRIAQGRESSVARFVNISCLVAYATSTHTAVDRRRKTEEALNWCLKGCHDLLSALLEQHGSGQGDHEAPDMCSPIDWNELMMTMMDTSDPSNPQAHMPLMES